MRCQGEEVRVDPKSNGILYAAEHWRVCKKVAGIVHHGPTGSQYYVDMDQAAKDRAEATGRLEFSLFEFNATLVYLPEGAQVPTVEEQRELGRAAIVVYLQHIAAWKPEVYEFPTKPDVRRINSGDKLQMN